MITFALAGIIEWSLAGLMMVAATAGGYGGTRLARALPKSAVRALIALIGRTMSGAFFWNG